MYHFIDASNSYSACINIWVCLWKKLALVLVAIHDIWMSIVCSNELVLWKRRGSSWKCWTLWKMLSLYHTVTTKHSFNLIAIECKIKHVRFLILSDTKSCATCLKFNKISETKASVYNTVMTKSKINKINSQNEIRNSRQHGWGILETDCDLLGMSLLINDMISWRFKLGNHCCTSSVNCLWCSTLRRICCPSFVVEQLWLAALFFELGQLQTWTPDIFSTTKWFCWNGHLNFSSRRIRRYPICGDGA